MVSRLSYLVAISAYPKFVCTVFECVTHLFRSNDITNTNLEGKIQFKILFFTRKVLK